MVAVSSPLPVSLAAVAVTVRAVFQFVAVNVSVLSSNVTSVLSVTLKATSMALPGCAASATV